MQSNGITSMTGGTTDMQLVPANVTVGGAGQVNASQVTLFGASNASADGSAVSRTSKAEKSSSGGGAGMCDEKTVEYLRDLIAEKRTIETNTNNNHSGTDDNNSGTSKSIVLRLLEQGKTHISAQNRLKKF